MSSKVQGAARLVVLVVVGFVANVLVGKLTLVESVKRVDRAVFDATVQTLQAVPGFTSVSRWLTDIGALNLNYLVALVVGLVLVFQRRHLLPGVLVPASMFAMHAFQKMTGWLVDGIVPTENVIGNAGPYFSGGVARVILLSGMIASLYLPASVDRRWLWRLSIGLGLLEAITRLALGRHWPLDLLAAFPIGLGALWLFRQVAAPWLDRTSDAAYAKI